MPSAITHQSWPGVRRRRVSQPSIHLPRGGELAGDEDRPAPALSRFAFGAKNSSLAASARPPTRAEARSASAVNGGSAMRCYDRRPQVLSVSCSWHYREGS